MSWIGPLQCPSCGAPWDTESATTVCPYGYAHHPDGAWQGSPAEVWWMSYAPWLVGLAIVAILVASDLWFGTRLLPRLVEIVDKWSS